MLITASGGTGNYQYSLNNGIYTNNNIFTGLGTGTYIFTIKDANGCIATATVVVPDGKKKCPVSIAQVDYASNSKFNVTVLPNPSSDYFKVFINSPQNSNVSIFVADMVGRKLYSSTGGKNTVFQFGEHFPSGMYIVTIMQNDDKKVLKLIKSK